jgi:hypothetical protein
VPSTGSEADSGSAVVTAPTYPPVHADRRARRSWGLAAVAVPLSLHGGPGRWRTVELPDVLAAECGAARVDLADAAARRDLLAVWMETGPAELFAEHVSFPQLLAEWPHLHLSELLCEVWTDCYPQLVGDLPPDDDDLPPF